MREASVNAQYTFKLPGAGEKYSDKGPFAGIDILKQNPYSWTVIMNGISHRILLCKVDNEENEIHLLINGKKAKVKLSSELDKLLAKLGLAGVGAKKTIFVKAPMPGMIYSVRVNEGDVVKKGDAILILEAMKMENVIKSAGDGVIGKIHIKPGVVVEKGQLLVSFK